MNVYKLQKNGEVHLVKTEADFIRLTQSRYPWVRQPANNPSENQYFALCPACSNPVKFVNLIESRRSPKSKRPHAAHNPHSVKDLAVYNQVTYDLCPLAQKSYSQAEKKLKKEADDPRCLEHLDLIRNYFDRIIYIFGKSTGIRYSTSGQETLLQGIKGFHNERIILMNKFNLPWCMGLSICQPFKNVMIEEGSFIHHKLQKLSNVKFIRARIDGYLFVSKTDSYDFAFVQSDYVRKEEQEYAVFTLGSIFPGEDLPKTELEIRVEAEPYRFEKLLNKPDWKNNERQLELARKIL